MAEYVRRPGKMVLKGMVLSKAPDLLADGEYAIAKNVRSYDQGVIESRPGHTLVADIDTLAADQGVRVRQLNSDTAADSTLVVLAGTKLYTGKTTFTAVPTSPTGWSGNPVRMIPFRPSRSPDPWMYIGDKNKMAKVGRVASVYTDYNVGIAPPKVAPAAALKGFDYKIVSDFDALTGWTAGGTAAVPTLQTRVSTTIQSIVFDSGTTGWASVAPVLASADLQSGTLLIVSTEQVLVDSVYNTITSTTIGSISYDSGSTGLCTIQLAGVSVRRKRKRRGFKTIPPPHEGLVPNGMLLVGSGPTQEAVRILSVTEGPDQIPSIRCSTINTQAAGGAVVGLKSFRANFTSTKAAGQAISSGNLQTAITTGIGHLTKNGALDLSQINGRPINEDDEMVIQIKVDDLSKVTEIQAQLDVDGSVNDFTRNYYFKALAPSEFVAAIKQTSTVQTAKKKFVQRIITDRFGRSRFEPIEDVPLPEEDGGEDAPTADEAATGDNQWTVLRFKIKDLTRVGSDTLRTLLDVASIRVTFNASANITASVDDWWVGGTFGPDVGDIGTPYLYRFRYRSSTTGSVSNPSPQIRSGVTPHRQRVQLTPTVSSDPQVDRIDWFRFGGSLHDWRYIGTGPNSGAVFNDDFPDDSIFAADRLDFDRFQPFAVVDLPRSGTCNVTGTSVTWSTGDQFNTALAEGTQIIINGIPHTLYAPPSSATRLELTESAGTLVGATFLIFSGTLAGQPLPAIWGPYGGGFSGQFLFGCGDPRQAGTLFWTRGNDPDAVSLAGQLEVTSGSEQLMNGDVYDGRAFVFSSEKMYFIYPNFGGQTDFVTQEVANSKGLFARYGLAVGPMVWFIGKDGIYESEGGQPRSITDPLYSLFPHDGQPGRAVYGINPPDFSQPDLMQLSYSDNLLYFDFKDTAGVFTTLVYNTIDRGWILDQYTPTMTYHYMSEGRGEHTLYMLSSDGRVFKSTGTSDNGSAIACQLRTKAEDFGDSRARKELGDLILDIDTGAANVTVTPFLNNYTTPLTASLVNTSSRSQPIIDLGSNEARNVGLDVAWTLTTTVKIFEWQPSALARPEDVKLRPTDWRAVENGPQLIKAIRLEVNTDGLPVNVDLQVDGGVLAQTFSVNHVHWQKKVYTLTTPIIAYKTRLVPAGNIRFFDYEIIADPYPDFSQYGTDWINAGVPGAKFFQRVFIEGDTQNSPVSIQIQKDGGTVAATITATHNGMTEIPYSFPAFISHQVRLTPLGNIRIRKAHWVYEPSPELSSRWEIQPTTFDIDGYKHCPDIWVSHISTADVIMLIQSDSGQAETYVISHSNGIQKVSFLRLRPQKGLNFTYLFTSSAEFRLFQRDSAVRVGEWGRRDSYRFLRPFGELSRESASRFQRVSAPKFN